jgi:2-succinyl-6-hydroxy-2,4-cyclohexadiene-1-carboxylate synthase
VLHSTIEGRGDPLVLVHGFTQSASSWDPLSASLAQHHTVVRVDAPGHGASSEIRADLPGGADMMEEVVALHGVGPAAWIGYSMGGRFALHVALRHPAAVKRLVLVSATAGIEDPTERATRRSSDEALARQLENEGLEPFVRWWLSQAMFATLPPESAQLETRLTGSAAGLASSLRLAGAGTQEPLWNSLVELSMPVLLLAGADDPKYAALAERMASAIGDDAACQSLPGAGHACHLERPERFLDLVTAFVDGQ